MTNRKKWEEKQVNLSTAIIVGAFVALVGAIIGLNWNTWFSGTILSNKSKNVIDWSSLDTIYEKLAKNYNGDIDVDELVEGAKEGMVAALGDKYTVYLNAERAEDYYNDLHGVVGAGIGVEMGVRDGYTKVLRTLPDNPARRAGILAGDIIYKIDDEEVWELTSEEIAKKVRGEAGTKVKVTIARDGESKDFEMVREEINNVSAYVDYDGDIAIISVKRFDNDTGKKVQEMAAEFKNKGVKKVVLDLRNNGGGYVSAAVDLLSLWLDEKEVIEQKSKHRENFVSKTSSGKDLLKDMKTVVLVNGSTASASEIVAGALKEYDIAKLVGEQTYGKGVVQTLLQIGDGSILKTTTAEWFTPNGVSINNVGVSPDVVVERSFDDVNKMLDPQLDKAKELLNE